MNEIGPKDAALLIEQGARLVDVREQYEWDEVHIDGAQLMPMSQYQGDQMLLAPAHQTIFICAHGQRSQTAADIYEGAWPGTGETYSINGGIVAWIDEGLPTTS